MGYKRKYSPDSEYDREGDRHVSKRRKHYSDRDRSPSRRHKSSRRDKYRRSRSPRYRDDRYRDDRYEDKYRDEYREIEKRDEKISLELSKSPKKNVSQPKDEEAKKKLEAKKLIAKQLLEKLKKEKEEREKLEREKREKEKLEKEKLEKEQKVENFTIKEKEVSKEETPEKNAFGMSVKSSKKEKKLMNFEEKDLTENEESKTEDGHTEEDSLDAYMMEIEKEVKNIIQEDVTMKDEPVKTITMEEILKAPTTEEKEQENVDDDEFHKRFMEELKKKSSQPKQEQEQEDEREFLFSDEEDEEIMVIDDPIAAEEKKNKKDLKPVDHSKVDYLSFRKDFYIPVREIKEMTQKAINELRKKHGIKVRGKNVPAPIISWVQCGLSDRVLRVIEKLEYDEPFAIQRQALPAIMSGRNVIGCAKTGSGKTLAFLLPMLRHILDQPDLRDGDGPIGLIIAPTRELAVQIFTELKKFAKALDLLCACIYGGGSMAEQIAQMKRGTHIVVCTPGRMIDLLCANRGRVTNLKRVTYVVLDEADRMFDMGFGPQITRIMQNIRPDRQIVMFSATFPKPLEALAKQFMKDPIEILVGGRSVVCDTVKQIVEIRSEETKFLRLLELLGEWYTKGNILIFVEKQEEADMLFNDLLAAGYQSLILHGGMEQIERTHTIQAFKKKEKTILVSTSVAARGLDVKDLNLVINYDVPNHYEDYVHRVGRTGRAGREGTAYTFITPDQENFAPDLVKALKISGTKIPEDLEMMARGFMEKRKQGLVQNYKGAMSGYKGSGFKFDETEGNKRKEEIKLQKKAMGLEEEEEEEDEQQIDEEGEIKPSLPKPILPPNAQGIEAAKAFAAALSVQEKIVGDKTHFNQEIEINDYPQQARWTVTHKDALYEIMEHTGCTVITKGVYFPPASKVPPGERKLYLELEGSSEEAVIRARNMIYRMLEEAASTIPQLKRTGKYRVV